MSPSTTLYVVPTGSPVILTAPLWARLAVTVLPLNVPPLTETLDVSALAGYVSVIVTGNVSVVLKFVPVTTFVTSRLPVCTGAEYVLFTATVS